MRWREIGELGITIDNFEHYKRSYILNRTRQMMRYQSDKVLILASRGYERAGYLPTRSTMPHVHESREICHNSDKDCLTIISI